MSAVAYKTIQTPVGALRLVANHQGVMALLWEDDNPRRVRLGAPIEDKHHAILLEGEHQLQEYFGGKRQTFTLPLAPVGTVFQKKVWAALQTIPFGETRSYGQIAEHIGHPTAVRAVGGANGRNPISIIVPCHRVIGANGKLTGFAGGLKTKAYLLNLEKQLN